MSTAILRAMLLGLLRDRGAMLMGFVLPALFFVIMAEIYTATGGVEVNLNVVIHDEIESEVSRRLVTALEKEESISLRRARIVDGEDLRALVRSGSADIGLILRKDAEPLDEAGGFGPAPLLILTDPSRGVAEPVLTGQIRRAYFSALPDIAMGNVVDELENQFITLSDEQRSELADGLDEMRTDAESGREVGWSFEDMLAYERVAGGKSVNLVAYSAGAVAFMFLLFVSVHGAVSLLEERESGVLDRILAGPGGVGVLVDGKFMFVAVQGFVQLSIIFLIAWLFYDVGVPDRFVGWLIITAAAAICAAGLAMLLVTLCSTRRQAQTVANTVILVISAVGGSMVPRIFMPELLKGLGWLTPNTWALEAYAGILWRGEGLGSVMLPVGLLALTGLIGWYAARRLAERRTY